MRLAIVMCASVAGAAFLAALNPAPRDAYQAAGTLVIPVREADPAVLRSRTLQAAEVLRQPNVVSEALERAQQRSEPGATLARLRVDPDPEAGIVGFSVRAATPEAAVHTADELARVAVEVVRSGRSPGELFGRSVVGDFEVDEDGWQATGSEPESARVGVVLGGRYGGGALRMRCEVASPCDVVRLTGGQFERGRPVTLTAWIRGRRPSRVFVSVGSASRNERAAESGLVTDDWRRFVVTWSPSRDERLIAVTVGNAGAGLADVDIDGVVVNTEDEELTPARERRLFAERNVAHAGPVHVVASYTGATRRWAAIGAGAGLVIGLAGVCAWTLAVRRRDSL